MTAPRTIYGPCPACNAKWKYVHEGKWYSRILMITDRERVWGWKCPDCGAEWKKDDRD